MFVVLCVVVVLLSGCSNIAKMDHATITIIGKNGKVSREFDAEHPVVEVWRSTGLVDYYDGEGRWSRVVLNSGDRVIIRREMEYKVGD